MKLLFSEAKADYANYVFPYAIWAFPEKRESAGQLFASGFLPSSRDLDRFYLCRHIRVDLKKYRASSENRRILRKGDGIKFRLLPRAEFDFTEARRDFYKKYADIRFGKDVMTVARLDALFNSKITSHVLLFENAATGAEAGVATLYLEPPELVYYYYAFYDLNYYARNLGMFMMTSAVEFFARERFSWIYLGSCYSENALYKAQFTGAEFFNGFSWSKNLKELKYLVRRGESKQHLLESRDFREKFYEQLEPLIEAGGFRVVAAPNSVSRP